ncbi:carboxylic ester hydrolase [Favolaschia claudopus]|uniref:Carboxylic ester hydrolase n=1 Tax=Favolaschia claudopus TaxID=2862362 RepID=A0AAW0D0W4_9AGAR
MLPKLLPFLLGILVSSEFSFAETHSSDVVSLPYGKFRGSLNGNVTQFLGVRYGHSERFRLPADPIPFDGVHNATAYGPFCPIQAIPSLGGEPAPPPDPSISEDCLTLDIIKPSVRTSRRLPVFIYIYGGGFNIGKSSDNDLKPLVERSIERGEPIIGITINHRTTAFGFLPGKEVADAGISNLGLRDQIFALKWIKNHISAFGGDPSRVILGGQSSGSVSTSYLTLDNKQNSNSLFHGAFMQSGTVVRSPPQSEGQADYDALVNTLNCAAAQDTLDCLRTVPFDSFMAAVNNTRSQALYNTFDIAWQPRIDGDVIVQNAWTSIRDGAYAKFPILSPICDDEGTIVVLPLLNITTTEELVGYLRSYLLQNASPAQVRELVNLYPDDPAQGSPFGTGLDFQIAPEYKRIASLIGDLELISPRRFFLQHASPRQNVWGSLSKLGKTTEFGAYHTSDTPVWFTNTTVVGYMGMDALLNFVNRLDPNSPSAKVFWPKWNSPSKEGNTSLLTFSDSGTVNITADNFREEGMALLNFLHANEFLGVL